MELQVGQQLLLLLLLLLLLELVLFPCCCLGLILKHEELVIMGLVSSSSQKSLKFALEGLRAYSDIICELPDAVLVEAHLICIHVHILSAQRATHTTQERITKPLTH